MASSILRLISSTRVRISTGIFRFPNSCYCSKGARMISTVNSVESPSTLPSRISPWLMLPPAFESDDMVYNFYNLAQNRVTSIKKRGCGGGGGDEELELPDDDAKLVGSSHGWLALFNKYRNHDLFLSNPLSRRHIKLPPLCTLQQNSRLDDYAWVQKVIISGSPDEEEGCRAVLIFGMENSLAFCWPGRSTEWTSFGESCYEEEDGKMWARVFEDFVYSSRQKRFFCLTREDDVLESWDLTGSSARMAWREEINELEFDEENYPWSARSEAESELQEVCRHARYLVFAEHSNQLFLVMRHIVERMGPDGSYVKSIYYDSSKGFDDSYPYKTIGFDVYEIDREDGRLRYMEGSLDGLAMFVGINHSCAISIAEFPELKPNSIYFSDHFMEFTPPDYSDRIYGGHDIGIFNYENRSFWPCYYPCDVQSIKRIVPAPSWFTPSHS